MIGMAWRFVRAMLRFQWAKWRGYETIAPVGVQEYRNTQCEKCAYDQGGQCALCDCLVLAKTMMAQEKCPVGRWSRVWIKRKMRRTDVFRRLFY